MYLNEFADPKNSRFARWRYGSRPQPVEESGSTMGLKMTARFILRPRERPGNRRRKLMNEWWRRRTYLIYRHVRSIYSPCVRDSAREFSPSQVSAANPFFKGPTDYS
jgi:hypothetical protein